jgi:tight adherence protein B
MQVAFFTVLLFLVLILSTFAAVFVYWRIVHRASTSGEPELQIFKEDEVSSISPLASFLNRFDLIDVLRLHIAQAGLDWSAGRVTAAILLTGALSFVAMRSVTWIPGSIALLLSSLLALLPYVWILQLRRKRLDAFEAQFPEALEALIRGLKAGHPFAASMELLSQEDLGPVTSEIRRMIEEWRLGMTWQQALDSFAARVPSVDVSIFVAAVKLQMRTGGRLSEVLLKLAESMRENVSIRGEVRAMAAQGRATGTVLSILPIVLGIILYAINPKHILLLFEPPGLTYTLICAVLLVIGHFVIRKVVDIRL